MKKKLSALVLFAIISTPALASENNPSPMKGMSHSPEHAQEIHLNLKELEVIMGEIKTEKNHEKLMGLIHKHMEGMKQGMGMMKGMKNEAVKQETSVRVDNLEARMEVMQSMMEQMMEHSSYFEKSRDDTRGR